MTTDPVQYVRDAVAEHRHGRKQGVMPITTLPLSLYDALAEAVEQGLVRIETNERGRRFIVTVEEN